MYHKPFYGCIAPLAALPSGTHGKDKSGNSNVIYSIYIASSLHGKVKRTIFNGCRGQLCIRAPSAVEAAKLLSESIASPFGVLEVNVESKWKVSSGTMVGLKGGSTFF